MDKQELFRKTAEILDYPVYFIEAFCMGGDEQALTSVTPEDLAAQILQYGGAERT